MLYIILCCAVCCVCVCVHCTTILTAAAVGAAGGAGSAGDDGNGKCGILLVLSLYRKYITHNNGDRRRQFYANGMFYS